MKINDETRRKLRLMKIGEFIEALEIQEQDPHTIVLPFEERFQQLTDSVYQQKYNDKVRRLIKSAKLRLPKADVHDILYTDKRPLNRNEINALATGQYIDDCKSIVLQGYSSSGKTYLGCALAKEACRQLHTTLYIRTPDLLSMHAEKLQSPGGREKLLRRFSIIDVLVLDEWLISELSKEDLDFLFELAERRFDATSTIFCTLYKRDDWLKRLGGGAKAESIIERYRYNATWIETGATNMRQIYSKDESSMS